MSIEQTQSIPVFLWLVAVWLLMCGALFIAWIYFIYRKLEYMEALLNKCNLVVFHKEYWGDSYYGRMARFSTVSGSVLLAKIHHRNGKVDLNQAKKSPTELRRFILWRHLLFVGVLLFVPLLKFSLILRSKVDGFI